MTDGKKIIYQRYLFKLSGSEEKRKSLKPKRNSWKQKYFIVYYQNDALILSWFDKKPSDDNVDPKGKVNLFPAYRLTKLDVDKHACEIVTQMSRVCVASNDQTTIDELVYYLQTQTSLKPGLQGVTYTVFPENNADLRRLGCIGNVCALHISPSGLSLIIQESRALVSQWPLRCIRTFEASGKGNFSFEAGRHAPFGPGVYEFQTRRLQDQEMYDLLDHYVLQATTDSQAAGTGGGGTTDVLEEIVEEYNNLKRLTVINTPTSIAGTRQTVRNSGLYDHIYNHDRGSGDITDWMATADIEGHDGLSDAAPPALPPRPPLVSMTRPGLPAAPPGVRPDTPPDTPPGLAPGVAEYEEPDRLSPTLVDSLVPPLPPRNPKRNSRPISQLNQYEDPDAVCVQATPTNKHNYQDIDEIIDSLPPAPPPPSFTPPTPPAAKLPAGPRGARPEDSRVGSAEGDTNNYEEIPTMPPPPVPMAEWEYSEPSFPQPAVNTYEDLDQLPCPLQAAPSSPHAAEGVAPEHYLTMTSPASPHTPPAPHSPPRLVQEPAPDGDMYFTMYDREPIQQPPTEITREKPVTASKPKPNVMPKPTSEKIASLRSKFEDVNVRKGRTKTQSMIEHQPERPKLAKKQSLPKFVDDEGLYLVCDVTEGAKLTLPSEAAGPSLCPPSKGKARESCLAGSSTGPGGAAAGDDYLDMVVPVESDPSQQDRDLYLDMSPGRGAAAAPDGDLYFDMSSPQTSPGPAFHVSSPEQVRKLAADDAYLDMAPVPAVQVTAPADEPAPGTPDTPDTNTTPLPFDVMNLTQFQTQAMLSRSTDGLDLDSDEDDARSRLSLPGPAFHRSLSNPALSDDKASRSRLSNFLYGTLRIKGRRKKKKEVEEEEQREMRTGESKFQKNKAYRASTGRAHKKYSRDIKVASNARSFVKSPAPEPHSRRATFGGDLDVDSQIQLRDRQLARPDGASYDVMSLGRRRPKHAVSTPNLL